ncbi:DUF4259 domain-containing protein [Micromonospora parva]|uniref:DUF4259 domain-containing protein n=1 Tax=Micromonospora parva TaxID=1464048 RepID=UPI003411DB15
MATWQLGPFDNDDAVEWCGVLDASTLDQHADIARQTLETAVTAGRALTAGDAARAVAAAATVLQSLTGVWVSDSAYAPRILIGREGILIGPTLRDLAIRALGVILAEGSAWRLRWADDIEEDEALAVIEKLRRDLVSTTLP